MFYAKESDICLTFPLTDDKDALLAKLGKLILSFVSRSCADDSQCCWPSILCGSILFEHDETRKVSLFEYQIHRLANLCCTTQDLLRHDPELDLDV